MQSLSCKVACLSVLLAFCVNSQGIPFYFDPLGSIGGAFNPSKISSCVLWLDASDASSLTVSNSFVAAWADKSGKGNNTAQENLTLRRIYAPSDPVANYKASTTASNGIIRYVTSPSLQCAEVYVVCAYRSGTDATFIDYATLIQGASQVTDRIGMGTQSANTWFTSGVLSPPPTKNGVGGLNALPMPLCILRFTLTTPKTFAWNIGAQLQGTRGWDGPICEVIMFSDALTQQNASLVAQYLYTKWGILP